MGGNVKRLICAVGVCALAVLACVFLYRHDNKYTAPGPYGMSGALLLDASDVGQNTFLVHGWAVYGGVLLAPEDFANGEPKPDEYIFIGQYSGFEKLTGEPRGSATYRIVVGVPEERRTYMLSLPEVYSSCRVYINGEEMLALGETDPDNYRFETGNAVIAFDAAGKIDIIIAVSDYRHLYSGMIYPPAIGSVETVTGMLEARLALRAAVLAVALLIGVSALLIGLLSGRRVLLALYGLLCLLFAGYACYPVAMTLGRGSPLFYAMESAAFCAILLVVIALQNKLYQGGGRTLRHIMYGFGGAVCLLALAMPLFRASMPVINAYSNLVEAYHWITSGYITVTAGLAVWKRARDITPVFWGMLVLDCTLVMDRVLSHFEPVLSGWFPEFGCFALVLSVGAAVARDIIRGYREKAVLEEQVRVIISAGSDHYRKMDALHEKLRILHHDVKYHLAAVGELAASGDNDGIGRYLSGVQARLSENGMRDYCSNNVINALLSSYAERCAQAGIRYGVEASLPEKLTIPDYDLCIVVGNLLENAVEACGRLTGGQYIDLWLKPLGEQLALIVRNSFDGRLAGKKSGGGLGLKSVDAVAAMYDGELTTEWDGESFTAGVTVRL